MTRELCEGQEESPQRSFAEASAATFSSATAAALSAVAAASSALTAASSALGASATRITQSCNAHSKARKERREARKERREAWRKAEKERPKDGEQYQYDPAVKAAVAEQAWKNVAIIKKQAAER